MPDIQTALKTALSKTLVEWDDDDVPPLPSVQPVSTGVNSVSAPSQNIQEIPMAKQFFPIRNNVCRETFNFIKNNPGSTRKEILTALDHKGFKEGSTSSIMSQLGRTKQIHATNGLYYTDANEYTPIKNPSAMAKKTRLEAQAQAQAKVTEPKRKYTKRDVTGIGALLRDKLDAPSTHIHQPRTTLIVRSQTPDDILKNLTVYQARDLYLHLKEIFGG